MNESQKYFLCILQLGHQNLCYNSDSCFYFTIQLLYIWVMVYTKMTNASWDVMSCYLVHCYQHFKGTCCSIIWSTVHSVSCFSFRLWYLDLVVSIEVAVAVCCFSLYSVVKQRLKCNTSKVYNCLIQFLLTVVLSFEEHVFLVVQQISKRTVVQ
jgi:hypothetical protein